VVNQKMKNIENVVVLMLENRGFDHLLGWLYEKDEQNKLNIISKNGDSRKFVGLSSMSESELFDLANTSPFDPYKASPIIKGATAPKVPGQNPGEHFVHIMAQMWGRTNLEVDWSDKQNRDAEIKAIQSIRMKKSAPMNGYLLDYYDVIKSNGVKPKEEEVNEIIQTYVPCQLPVLSGLARYYAVSDEWFCSVPSQTNTNRAFSMAATSRGLVTNNFYDAYKGISQSLMNPGISAMSSYGKVMMGHGGSHSDQLPANTRNIFGTLSQHQKEWKVFWQDPWPPQDVSIGKQYQYVKTMFPELKDEKYKKNFVKFDAKDPKNELFKQAREGTLPAVTWIEPKWGGGQSWNSNLRQVGNDMHPVCDTTIAEDFVAELYRCLTSSEKWNKTLFVITFDENGGTYDHVSPPTTSSTGLDRAPMPNDYEHMDIQTRTEFGFDFEQLGIRVPTLFISPLIKRNTIIRSDDDTKFDHTSLIATILTWQNIDRKYWGMGKRVDQAPLFDGVLQMDKPREPESLSEALNVDATKPWFAPTKDPIKYSETVYLQWVGSRWPEESDKTYYLSSASWSRLGRAWYPTISEDKCNAIPVVFLNAFDDEITGPLLNMSEVKIVTKESAVKDKCCLGAFHNSKYLYYWKNDDESGIRWQIRSFSSRDEQGMFTNNDDIYLVSKLAPNKIQNVSERVSPDPLQRMVMSPDDREYLTTKAGEWGIWKVLKELPIEQPELI
jgi:phospholipase C